MSSSLKQSVSAALIAVSCILAPALGSTEDSKDASPQTRPAADTVDRGLVWLLDSSKPDYTVSGRLQGQILFTFDPFQGGKQVDGVPTTRPTTLQGYLTLSPSSKFQKFDIAYSTQLSDLTTALKTDQLFQNRDLLGKYYFTVKTQDDRDAAYLGVGVEAPSDSLRSQLSLPDGAGLVVNYVDDNSPSMGTIEKHDLLQKLDDQILVNEEQFVTLVRMHKPGDVVTLTLMRHASPRTEKIKLGKKPANDPKNVQVEDSLRGGMIKLSRDAMKAHSPISFNDGEFMASLDDHGQLLALDMKSSKTLFHGPINDKEQWDRVPEFVRKKLEFFRDLIAGMAADESH